MANKPTRFGGLTNSVAQARSAATAPAASTSSPAIPIFAEAVKAETTRPGRANKCAIVGYFSRDMRKELQKLAIDQGITVQALLGEAVDDFMVKHGKHPFGER